MNDDLKERYEERAAIMHFCGGIPKEKAEALALAECETYRLHREKIDADKFAQQVKAKVIAAGKAVKQ